MEKRFCHCGKNLAWEMATVAQKVAWTTIPKNMVTRRLSRKVCGDCLMQGCNPAEFQTMHTTCLQYQIPTSIQKKR